MLISPRAIDVRPYCPIITLLRASKTTGNETQTERPRQLGESEELQLTVGLNF